MYAITDRFKRAIKRSHTISTHVEVLDQNWAVLHNDLYVTQGNASVNSKNANRRSCSVTVVDPTGELTPSEATDLLHPISGNRFRLWRGIQYAPRDTEEVSLGVFDIYDSDTIDSGENMTTQLRGFDFSKRIQRARLESNYKVDAGTNYGTAIEDLVRFAWPGVETSFATVTAVAPDLVFGASGDQVGGDPWKYAQEMAASIGHEIFFDIQGYCILRPVPGSDDPIVWEYAEGDDAMLLHLTRRIRIENTFNKIIATGENSASDNPVRGEAIDNDPNSPTYYGGPYGEVPGFFRSSYIRTQEQATEAAEARLRQVKGATESVQVTATPNPAHEAGDVVQVTRANSKIDSRFVIDSFNVNLSAQQAMNISMRDVGTVGTA